MKSPKIFFKFDQKDSMLYDFLWNIDSITEDINNANIILTDNESYVLTGYINFVITEKMGKNYITLSPHYNPQQIYQMILQVLSTIYEQTAQQPKPESTEDVKEESIVAGFARHFSHNVLNSLLMASGFIKLIKSNTTMTEQLEIYWRSVEQKMSFIEELVNGYSDYYQVLNLKIEDEVELNSTFHDLIVSIADKSFERSFSAYLYNYKNSYTMYHEASEISPYYIKANPLFLKLAFCYIIKDTVRYLKNSKDTSTFYVETDSYDSFTVTIYIRDVNIPEDIIQSMFKPWDHQTFLQSFDYWGIAIAKIIISKHGGKLSVDNYNNDLRYIIEF